MIDSNNVRDDNLSGLLLDCDDDVAEEDYENVEDLFDGSEKARLPFGRETVFSCVENLNITFGKVIHRNKGKRKRKCTNPPKIFAIRDFNLGFAILETLHMRHCLDVMIWRKTFVRA
ncbi:hypothetical protein LXL04_020618 [Taraxacum kok-saghyz]